MFPQKKSPLFSLCILYLWSAPQTEHCTWRTEISFLHTVCWGLPLKSSLQFHLYPKGLPEQVKASRDKHLWLATFGIVYSLQINFFLIVNVHSAFKISTLTHCSLGFRWLQYIGPVFNDRPKHRVLKNKCQPRTNSVKNKHLAFFFYSICSVSETMQTVLIIFFEVSK